MRPWRHAAVNSEALQAPRALMSAPASSNSGTTLSCPSMAAVHSGVRPSFVARSTVALPSVMSIKTTFSCPRW